MALIKSLTIAFGRYSALPVPRFSIREQDARLTPAVFPAVGLVCGGMAALWVWLCGLLGFGKLLCAAGAALSPVLVTGGIHLNESCIAVRKLSSSRAHGAESTGTPQSRASASWVPACCILLSFALFTELRMDSTALWCLTVSFVLSRVICALAASSFPYAADSDAEYSFADEAVKRQNQLSLSFTALLCAAGLAVLGAQWLLPAAAIVFGIYYCLAIKHFGGITEGLSGWFLQLVELVMLFVLIINQRLSLL